MNEQDVTLSEVVIRAVARRKGVSETDLGEPLYDAVNPDSLDTLFRDASGEVTFRYLDLLVTVRSNRDVELRDADEARTAPPSE